MKRTVRGFLSFGQSLEPLLKTLLAWAEGFQEVRKKLG